MHTAAAPRPPRGAGAASSPILLIIVVVGCQLAVLGDVLTIDIPVMHIVVGKPSPPSHHSVSAAAVETALLPLVTDHSWLLLASPDADPSVAPVPQGAGSDAATGDAPTTAGGSSGGSAAVATTTEAPVTHRPVKKGGDTASPLANAALVVLCYNRPRLLQDTLEQLRRADGIALIKKYISQDGNERQTREVAQGFAPDFEYMSHPRTLPERLKLNTTDPDRQVKDTPGTMYLAAHYKWMLDRILLEKNHSHAILVEDDLLVSVDFVRMFEATAPVLDADPSLWCVSSWNDNGFPDYELPAADFFRSSFFPGLGWMLKRETWAELSPRFPDDNWDHWMRVSTTHRGRSCLVPFLSRNRNAGEIGATSNTDFYETYLKRVVSLTDDSKRPAAFNTRGLLEWEYDEELSKALGAAQVIGQAEVYLSETLFQQGKTYVVPYRSGDFGQSLSQSLHLHPTPRTHYKGVTWLRYNKAQIFLVDMRTSELAPFAMRELADPSLQAVRASGTHVNCIHTCQQFGAAVHEDNWVCDERQFDYINDCQVLAAHFDGCPMGCTQGWGEDIPNMESWEVGTDKPQCLVTEMAPTCAASHRLTTRLCPCVKRDENNRPQPAVIPAPKLAFAVTRRTGENCFEACADYHRTPQMDPTHRCDDRQMTFANTCAGLKQRFGCATCERSASVKAAPSASQDKTVCYLPVLHAADCARTDADQWRLCSCVPIDG